MTGVQTCALPILWSTYFDDVTFVDAFTRQPQGSVREYALLNAQVAYHLKLGAADGKAFVQAFNLLDHKHREHPEGQSYGLILTGGVEIAW